MPGMFAIGEPIPVTAPKHGLQASATDVSSMTPRWELGVTMPPSENCFDVGGWDPDCATILPDDPALKPLKSDAIRTNTGSYDVDPYVIESAFACDAVGLTAINFPGRARRQLEAGTSKFMEFETWTGTLKPDNPHLDEGAVIIGGSAAFSVLQGLILLGAALSACSSGSQGMIHAPTFVVDYWMAKYALIDEVGTKLVTKNRGDTVVSGSGYPGTGPDGSAALAAGQSWVYATGPVQYRLGEIIVFPDTVKEAVNRRNNDAEYRAERFAAVAFDECCHFAILVDVTL